MGDPIAPTDHYSIRIDHAVITDLIEEAFSFRRLLNERPPFRRVGEVAILAHVFEFAATDADATTNNAQFANFSNLGGVRVVYFNPDVEEGQALNFANIPIQESREYHGRPIGIQIIVLELDRMSGPMRNLMKTLAELGQNASYLPSGPAATALLQLGTSLISQDNDDIMFEYRFVLDRAAQSPSVGTAPFEAGRYVLRRTNERRQMQRWDDLQLDHNTGQLMRRVTVGETVRYLPFEEETYITLDVVRHPATGAFAYPRQTLDQLSTELSAAAARRDEPLAELNRRAAAALAATRSRRWIQDLTDAWDAAAARYRAYGRQFTNPASIDPTCTAASNADRDRLRETALFEARTLTSRFLTLYAEAKGAEAADAGTFGAEAQRALLASLSPFFAPFASDLTANQLADPSAFEAGFVSAGASKLFDAATNAAQRNWSPRNCSELVAAGLATQAPPPGTNPGGQ